MEVEFKAEVKTWIFFVFVCTIWALCIISIPVFVLNPVYRWFVFGDEYVFPSCYKFVRMGYLIVFLGISVGTIMWISMKKK